jgi:ADP-heptose:LPS heptosyltransferase
MTTKAMQGLKARHGDLPLVYMTQAKFHEILDGNPYIDEVINWDPFLMENRGRYRFFYAPHNDIVLPGHWGRNCNSLLSDFYWRLIGVSKGEFYIRPKRPESRKIREAILGKRVCVVHTTGGDPHMRTYKYMPEVCRHLKGYVTVQLGGPDDWPAGAELDFRGLLSYRESAWVMAQACLAVTVDSFMSHLAGAMGVSQVCLFGCGNAHVVQPEQVSGRLVCLEPDYLMDCPGLGPCSGQVRDCPVPCMGVHDPAAIVDKLAEIERAIGAHQPVAHPDAEACHG